MYSWKDDYSVKITKIDQQHKKLFETFSILSSQMTKSSNKRELDKAINQCERAVLNHFKDEEKILKKCKYKNFDEHKHEHKQFAKKIKRKLKDFRYSNHTSEDIFEVYSFLNDWLVDHIMDSDHKYIDDVKDFHDC
ncbi:bacteriohemerythrin [Peptostreptococcaceae bacterium AGR-M142]